MRNVAIALAVLLALTVYGCGKKEEAAQAPAASVVEQAAQAATPAEQTPAAAASTEQAPAADQAPAAAESK